MPEIPNPPDIRRKRRPAHADDEPGARTTAMEAIPAEPIEACVPTVDHDPETDVMGEPPAERVRRLQAAASREYDEALAAFREIDEKLADMQRTLTDGPPPLVEPGEETGMMPAQRALDVNFDWADPASGEEALAQLHAWDASRQPAVYLQLGRRRVTPPWLFVALFVFLTVAWLVGIVFLGARP